MNKKGEEDLLITIGYVAIFVAVYLMLAYWVNGAALGDLAKDQAITKQVAMLIDSAPPGTEIEINKELDISKAVVLKTSSYSFF